MENKHTKTLNIDTFSSIEIIEFKLIDLILQTHQIH